MKLFELQTNLYSYKYPLIKIIVCIIIIAISILRNNIVEISVKWLSIAVSFVCFIMVISSILCIYISVGELFHTYYNRNVKEEYINNANLRKMTINEIETLLKNNDIIKIDIVCNNKIYTVGASSDCKISSSVFTDKSYYINDIEFLKLESVLEALLNMFSTENVPVLKIDDITLK